MKIAIEFSGQLRNGRSTAQRWLDIIAQLRQNHQVDIFAHVWAPCFDTVKAEKLCPGYENLTLSSDDFVFVSETYKPTRVLGDDPKSFKNPSVVLTDENINKCFSYGLKYPNFKENYVNNSFSMWYSIYQSNLLKRLHELATGTVYDLVIKSRYDTVPTKDISPLQEIKENELVFQNLNQPDHMISDWFFAGSSRVMDVACNLFNNWDQCYDWAMEHDGYWCNELLLKHQVLSHNISPRSIDIGVQF